MSKASLTSTLPAKITGIVFWGVVVVGLIVAVVLLQGREQERANAIETSTDILASRFEYLLGYKNPEDFAAGRVGDLNAAAQTFQNGFGFSALRIDLNNNKFVFGTRDINETPVIRHLVIHSATPGRMPETARLTVFYPDIEQQIAQERKHILLLMGLLLFSFGLILQQVMKRVLTEPFLKMVDSAQTFSRGQLDHRMDESRADEFGFLSKFINKALDSALAQQEELKQALKRATQSERELYAEKERVQITLRSIADAVITTDQEGRITYMNPVAERLTGWSLEDAMDSPVVEIVEILHEDTRAPLPNPIHTCLQENQVQLLPGHAAMVRQGGSEIAIEASAAPIYDDGKNILGAVMVIQDVSQARTLSHQLSYQASHDALTGLLNRRKFEERLESALSQAWDENRRHALCYLDLDQFKIVNDTCGHMAGDELLRQLSMLLQDNIREGDTLARLGGDEFGVLLENCHLEQAQLVAEKLRASVREFRFGWQDKSFEIGVSIGLVAITAENESLAGLLSSADLACYAAKDAGRNRIHVYEHDDATLAQRYGEMHWVAQITQAIDEDRLLLYQQPIQNIGPGDEVPHLEILLRMRRPDDSIVTPDSFIPAAERYNLMPNLDRWVINSTFEALSQGLLTDKSGHQPVVSINLSGASLTDDGFLEFIRNAVAEHLVDLTTVCFEITETVAISNISSATTFMRGLKELGCQFALDDFGSGLSSFGYLKTLPVDYLKIDGGFVKDMVDDPIDRAMVEAITQIGHLMNLKTIAEWAEDQATLDMLVELGVDFAQGYICGKPAPIKTLPELDVISAGK